MHGRVCTLIWCVVALGFAAAVPGLAQQSGDVGADGSQAGPPHGDLGVFDLGLNGKWQRVADGLVLEVVGDEADFPVEPRADWQGSPPAFVNIAPAGPNRWVANSQEQYIATGEITPTDCVLVLVGDVSFIATCRGTHTIYRDEYRRVHDELNV